MHTPAGSSPLPDQLLLVPSGPLEAKLSCAFSHPTCHQPFCHLFLVPRVTFPYSLPAAASYSFLSLTEAFAEHLMSRLGSGNKAGNAWPLTSLFWGHCINNAVHAPVLEGCQVQGFPTCQSSDTLQCRASSLAPVSAALTPLPDLFYIVPFQGVLGTKTEMPKLSSSSFSLHPPHPAGQVSE